MGGEGVREGGKGGREGGTYRTRPFTKLFTEIKINLNVLFLIYYIFKVTNSLQNKTVSHN